MHGDIAPPPPSLAPTEVGWRGIESAPKDRAALFYHPPREHKRDPRLALPEVIRAGWMNDWPNRPPTHWMPLPPPPDNTPGVGGEGDRSAQSQPSGLPASQDSSGLGSEPSEAGDLASCPFCGSRGEEVGLCYEAGQTPAEGRDWFVRCYVCHVETAREDTAAEAIAAWNRRTASDWQSRPAPPQATLANKERQP